MPLRYALRNGDTVEILASANQKPSKDWLKFVVTSRAKTKIRHYIRMEQRERSRADGARSAGARAAQAQDASLASSERDGLLDTAAHAAARRQRPTICWSPSATAASAPSTRPTPCCSTGWRTGRRRRWRRSPSPRSAARRPIPKRSIGGIRVQGEADILVKFAKCCTPVPGDTIVGFISRGHGVVIHTRECPKALDLDPARRVDVAWDDEAKTLRPVAVQVTCADRPGLLAAISKLFTEHGVNISQAKCRTTEDGRAVNTFQVTVGHLDQLKTVLRSLQNIEGVVSATRL